MPGYWKCVLSRHFCRTWMEEEQRWYILSRHEPLLLSRRSYCEKGWSCCPTVLAQTTYNVFFVIVVYVCAQSDVAAGTILLHLLAEALANVFFWLFSKGKIRRSRLFALRCRHSTWLCLCKSQLHKPRKKFQIEMAYQCKGYDLSGIGG